MKRQLISWIGLNNDFIESGDKFLVNENGPTFSVHQMEYDYDNHYVLSSASETSRDLKTEILCNYIITKTGHKVSPVFMNIADIIDIEEIKNKVSELLLSLRNNPIEIFISPGTPAMQVVWYLLHANLGLDSKIFQTRPGKYSASGINQKIYVQLEKSSFTSDIIIRNNLKDTASITDKEILITTSVRPAFELAYKVAQSNSVTCLITGETGTGKEVLAKYLHVNSSRRKYPFIAINCSGLSDDLLESRLFGFMKGSFTGAVETKNGLFTDADKGTVFLDEIGDISPKLQQLLLRVLQEKVIAKIGSSIDEKINVRIIAASNKDLLDLCEKGLFRWDLFYRLAIAEIDLPPLRIRAVKERKEIIAHFIKSKGNSLNKKPLQLSNELEQALCSYPFPGNLRELENLIERLYIYSTDELPGMQHLPKRITSQSNENNTLLLKQVEKNHILKVLRIFENNKTKSCAALGISINTLNKKIKTNKR